MTAPINRSVIVSRLIIFAFTMIMLTEVIPSTAAGSRICAGCHAGRLAYASWRASPHQKVPCSTCHGQPGLGGFFSDQLKAARNGLLTLIGSGGGASVVSNDACTACHTRIVDDLIVRRGVRIDHRAPHRAGWRCGDCHGSVGHKLQSKSRSPEPTFDKCFSCHRVGGIGDYQCPLCHVERIEADRLPGRSAGSLNHKGNWSARHGQANLLTCRNCHTERFCLPCHSATVPHSDSWITAHGRVAKADKTACPDCHRRVFCRDCHGVAMPHAKPYYPRHGREAAVSGDSCPRCHEDADCTKCHTTHVEHPLVTGAADD